MLWGRRSSDRDTQFTEFVSGAYPGLTRTAYLVLGDRQLAEDVVQNALVNLYRRWDRVEHVDGPGPYARRAVVNAALSERRRPHRRHEHTDDRLPEHRRATPGAGGSADPADQLRDESVIDALRDLPPKQRAVIVLRFVEDVDVVTTARILGVAEGTVKSQTSKALATLRGRLSDDPMYAPLGKAAS